MKALTAVLLLISALAAPAVAGDYTMNNRPEVIFKVWVSDACWRDCKSSCTWKMEYCVRASDPDLCRPGLDACDRSCQRTCRGFSGGPLLGFFDF